MLFAGLFINANVTKDFRVLKLQIRDVLFSHINIWGEVLV